MVIASVITERKQGAGARIVLFLHTRKRGNFVRQYGEVFYAPLNVPEFCDAIRAGFSEAVKGSSELLDAITREGRAIHARVMGRTFLKHANQLRRCKRINRSSNFWIASVG